MNFSRHETLISPTGAHLALRRMTAQYPSGKQDGARGIVVINHGLVEHSLRYQHFAEALAARSYHVFVHDHRGHGHTKADDAPLGQFASKAGAEKVFDDTMAVHAMATAAFPGLPVILFGHSLGGLIAINVATRNRHAFAGLAVWNANLNPGVAGAVGQQLLKVERMLKGSDVASSLAPKLTFDAWAREFPDRITGLDWLSSDPQEVAAYIADPLCGFDASISMWMDVLGMASEGAKLSRLAQLPAELPVHLVGGGMDPATGNGSAMVWLKRRMTAAGLRDVDLTIYPSMRHETLNEIGRQEAIDGFIAWCDHVTT